MKKALTLRIVISVTLTFILLFCSPLAAIQKTTPNPKKNKNIQMQKQIPTPKHKGKPLPGPADTRTLKARAPEAQVVNNSGRSIHQAKIGNIVFSRNLDSCSDGCSTGFKMVRAGRNSISVQLDPGDPWIVLGSLDGFENNRKYAVNLVAGGRDQGCAQLFLRHQTDSTFNADGTKEMVAEACTRISTDPPIAQVVNNSGSLIYQVKIGNVIFYKHLGYCADGCSTGFKKVKPGRNRVYIKATSGSAWAEIGSLDGFEDNVKYAVNLVRGSRRGEGCAQLFIRHQTDSTFNADGTKEMLGEVCSRPSLPADPRSIE